MDATTEGWDKVRGTGAGGVAAIRELGSETRGQARSVKDTLSGRIAERRLRQHDDDDQRSDEQG